MHHNRVCACFKVIDKSGQWWKVKNRGNEEGYVPQNVLEPVNGQKPTVSHGQCIDFFFSPPFFFYLKPIISTMF